MIKNSKARSALLVSVGLLAGYALASGKFNPFHKADAGPPGQSASFDRPAEHPEPARARADGIPRADDLLARLSTRYSRNPRRWSTRTSKGPHRT